MQNPKIDSGRGGLGADREGAKRRVGDQTKKKIEERAEVWQSSAYERRREDDRKNWKVRKTNQEGTKRPKKEQKTEGKRHKKRKYDLLPEDWGEQQEEDISPTMNNPIVQNLEEGEP